ncbi:hypothetical protein DPMN_125942 [Dreissena polymorpha]|uniref:Uncharacterized protein n=1 Tax=Dreissena polymorpha TaxID=45954 RepID=A0A9D4GZ82_DREPO|nr:hypothetical protein DPMN_125942 [Dreissena polymorpha]
METAKKPRVQYRCKKCQKTDRKGRLVGHFFKYHVTFDQVPYAGQAQLFQPEKTPNSTAGAKFVKSVVTPGTPIQDEIVLQLDDTSSLDLLDEEPLELLAQ